LPSPPPVTPDNSLPTTPPGAFVLVPLYAGSEPLEANDVYVLKLVNGYGWILVPEFESAGQPSHPIAGGRPPRPDQGLPPSPGRPDQGLPPTAQPRR